MLLLLLLSGCSRDFAPADTGLHIDPDDAGVDGIAKPDVATYLDLAQTKQDLGASADLVGSFADCGVELEHDGGPVGATQACSVNSDWACGRGCGVPSRLLCVDSVGTLLREIRCREDGFCFCNQDGAWQPCLDDNTGRLGCIRAREALVDGCCKP
jgi:hypothetical protein